MRVYYAPIESVTFSAAGDMWQIATNSSTSAVLLGWEITSSATAAEDLELKLVRFGTAGTGGTGMDENPADETNTVTSGVTGLAANSTPGSTLTDLQFITWEQLGPVGFNYPPEMRISIKPSSQLGLVCSTTPTSFELSGWVCWGEY